MTKFKDVLEEESKPLPYDETKKKLIELNKKIVDDIYKETKIELKAKLDKWKEEPRLEFSYRDTKVPANKLYKILKKHGFKPLSREISFSNSFELRENDNFTAAYITVATTLSFDLSAYYKE